MACTIILRWFWGAEQANSAQGRGNSRLYILQDSWLGWSGNTFWFGVLKGKQASEGQQGISFYVFSSSSSLLLLTSEQLLELFPHHHLPSSHQKWLKMKLPAFLSCLDDFSDLTSDKQHTTGAKQSWWEEMDVSGYPEGFERTHVHFSSQTWAAGFTFWHTDRKFLVQQGSKQEWTDNQVLPPPLKSQAFLQNTQFYTGIILNSLVLNSW